MAMTIESLWTSSPICSLIALMVWLFVCVHSMNQNDSPAYSEDVLAALPARATRDLINSSHTTIFNLQTAAVTPSNSHKV